MVRPEARIAEPALHGVAEQPLGLTADKGELEGAGVGFPDDAADGMDQVFQALARAPRGLFGALAAGDCGDEPFQGEQLALGREDAPAVLPDPFLLALSRS